MPRFARVTCCSGRTFNPREAGHPRSSFNEIAPGKAIDRALELAREMAAVHPPLAHIKRLARTAIESRWSKD